MKPLAAKNRSSLRIGRSPPAKRPLDDNMVGGKTGKKKEIKELTILLTNRFAGQGGSRARSTFQRVARPLRRRKKKRGTKTKRDRDALREVWKRSKA